jgi:ABC-type Fe3+/spermidine/putrescine transport system ATPase subunit
VAYLDLQDLRKQFGAYTALDGISVSLEEGEFLSLLGPSG